MMDHIHVNAPVDVLLPRADFSERLTHTDLRTMRSFSLSQDSKITSDGYVQFTDPKGWITCEAGSKAGDFRNFKLKQRDGTWTETIPSVEKLPDIFREYLFHLYWENTVRHARAATTVEVDKTVLSPGRDIASAMNFRDFLANNLIVAGAQYAQDSNMPGYIAISDSNRNVEFYLDEITYTPFYACIRLIDGHFSPPFLFSQLPPEWQKQAQRFYGSLSPQNAVHNLCSPERPEAFDQEKVTQVIDQQNLNAKYRLFMVVGTSGIGKDTVIDASMQWAQKHIPKLKIHKSKSRVTDRTRRTGEKEDDNTYLSKGDFTQRALSGTLIHPYQSRQDDRYAYDPEILSAELANSNVTITIANSDHYLGVFAATREKLKALGLPETVLVLIDKDISQTHVSIDGRDAASEQKDQRITTAKQYQAGFRSDVASGGPLHPVINNYMMYSDAIQRFLSIIADHAE
ncbi:MAG: hypothetical protein O3A81_02240 [bacterium]|nr:hypothetical protein [bacterium]